MSGLSSLQRLASHWPVRVGRRAQCPRDPALAASPATPPDDHIRKIRSLVSHNARQISQNAPQILQNGRAYFRYNWPPSSSPQTNG